MAMSDSGVALVLSTGLLQRASSDDELLGIVAHELGHEYYTRRSYDLRQRYNTLSTLPDATVPINQVLAELSRVELDCDAFSAMTLATIGRNPTEFAKHLLSVDKEYNHQVQSDHPAAQVRARLITGIIPDKVLSIQPQTTRQLQNMKALVAQLN
jgi:predicted Zn-dependent protease